MKERRRVTLKSEVRSRESAFRRLVTRHASLVTFLIVTCHLSLVTLVPAYSWEPEDALRNFLEKNYPWERIDVSNVSFAGNVPDKAPDLIIVEKGPVGKGVFVLVFDGDQKVIAKADVRVLDVVVKSKRPFSRGYVLQDDDLYLSEMDINRMPKGAVRDHETVIGKPLKRSVPADAVIVDNMVDKTQAVKKGRKVVLLISGTGFSITAAGEIREKGYVGTQVKAMNLSSKKEVRGVLVDENTIRVEL
ncbi:MAG: flagellar basal body P-ring formation protein FlgA [Nitrospirae bacterium]|nr:flagellar basal body P-ring formation protein FlgA [Nitrospirota bacterium]